MMACRLLAVLLLGTLPMTVAAESWTLGASAWARPRDARAVLSMPPLPEVVRAWSRQPDARLVIHYPGGEAGELWAHELQDWLVALGVPAAALATMPGAEPGALRLEVTGGRE